MTREELFLQLSRLASGDRLVLSDLIDRVNRVIDYLEADNGDNRE